MKISPVGDRVVIQRDEAVSKTPGGLLLPEQSKTKQYRGVVVAVGDGEYQNGVLTPMRVKTKDHVVFSNYSGETVEVDGTEYAVVRERDILAVLT